jgi:hypothetical protein
VQASVEAVETREVPPDGAASAPSGGRVDAATPRRLSQRTIALAGLALGVGFITAIALAVHVSNDELWSLAAGQWMLSHHRFMGLDPFSYTESHRRWVTDEWGSEVALAGLYRAYGTMAYTVYATVLGGCCLLASAAYARTLGARGGRIVIIVLLLSFGLAGTIVMDRGLDFSLVWFPLELLILAKARATPSWLCALPVLCLAWVNTHGSILLGLLVIVVELSWSLVPRRLVSQFAGTSQSVHGGALALALVGSVLASCITPYGPGLLVYDAAVSNNGQIGAYIAEWNSPNFHALSSLVVFLVPLAVLVACVWARRLPVLEISLTVLLFVASLRTERLTVYLLLVTAGLAAALPARPVWDATLRRWAGAAMVLFAVVILAIPSVPAGSVSPTLPVQAFDDVSSHPGRIFTEYAWGDYSISRHRATFVDGRTDLFEGRVLAQFIAISDLTTDPDPILDAYHVRYVIWSPRTPLAEYLAQDPRWRVVDRTRVALVFARR